MTDDFTPQDVYEIRGAVAPPLDDRQPPPVLYHYTTSAGFLGILESRALWATDISFLNDASEFEYGTDQIFDALEPSLQLAYSDRFADGPGIAHESWTEYAHGIFRGVINMIEVLKSASVHAVTCYCEDGDLLSQWRGYASGGFSIGLESASIAQIARPAVMPLVPVVYGQLRDYTSAVNDHLGTAFRDVLALKKDDHFVSMETDKEALLRWADLATGYVMSYASQIKDDAFSEEREWRTCAISPSADASFRAGKLGVVPYLTLDLADDDGRLPIKEIVMGPGSEPRMQQRGVSILLDSLGYDVDAIEIRPSRIPYRA